jgi:hypothetical protein
MNEVREIGSSRTVHSVVNQVMTKIDSICTMMWLCPFYELIFVSGYVMYCNVIM